MKIFISYGREDARDQAKALYDHLRQIGHDPWLDTENGIPPGAPFDFAIETAISDSQLLIALLTESSLKPNGFCRNELLFAQTKKLPILPVLLHKIIPPIQIISLNYLDASDKKTIPFKRLQVMIDSTVRHRPLPDEPLKREKAWWASLRSGSYHDELTRHGGTFFGRRWLFDDIESWIKQPQSRLLLITAGAGVGKSALAAQMTVMLNVRGIHFCSRSNIESCFPRSWISELVYQLARQFPAYRYEVDLLNDPNWGDPPVSLLRNLVIEPLRRSESHLDHREPWVFIIDGLDESVAEAGSALVDLLTESAERIPAWFRIVATSRPDQEIIAKFAVKGARQYPIKPDHEANARDLQEFLEKYSGIVAREKKADALHEKLASIRKLAAGNFLYAKLTLEALADPELEDSFEHGELPLLPGHLCGLYDIMFRTRFKDQKSYGQDIVPLLDCLITARGPLPESLLLKACQLPERLAQSGLLTLSQFLNRDRATCQLFHQSLAEWLKDKAASTRFAASLKNGHGLLAEACWSEYQAAPQRLSDYVRTHMPTHLAENEGWDRLLVLMDDRRLDLFFRWIEGGEGAVGLTCLRGVIRYLDERAKEKTVAAGLATQIARIHGNLCQYGEAESWLHYARARTSYWKGRRLRAIALHELGSLELYKREYDRSASYYRKALRLCKWGLPAYLDEEAANLIGLATVCQARYEYGKAIRYAQAALKKAWIAEDLSHVLAGERLLGQAYKSLGQYEDSRRHISRGLHLSGTGDAGLEKTRMLSLQGWLEYELATCRREPPLRSRPLFEQALAAANQSHDLFAQMDAKLSMIWCDLAEGKTKEIEEQLMSIKDDLPKERHLDLHIDAELALAVLKHKGRDWQGAEKLYRKVMGDSERYGYRFLQAKATVGLGAIRWHSGRTEEATTLWGQAVQISKRISRAEPNRIEISIEMCKDDAEAAPR